MVNSENDARVMVAAASTLTSIEIDMRTWIAEASCTSTETDLFFRPDSHMARRVCSRCPVQVNCLAYALQESEPYGVWGGLTPAQRERYGRHGWKGGSR